MNATTQQAAEAVQRIADCLPAEDVIALHEPRFGARERALVDDCIDSGWVSSVGRYVDRFETELANYSGIGHAVATVNGTCALQVCLQLAGVRPGDEVLAPALTFVGTINPIQHLGATPHFVDCEAEHLAVDPEALEAQLQRVARVHNGECVNRHSGRTLRALVVVHVLGIPARMDELAALAERWHLTLIEDAAEALGSFADDKHCGSWGLLSALSFNGNKIITTGGGGAILTNDAELAARAKSLTTTAKQPHPWHFVHDEPAYNFRLPNLNAALGCAQLEQLPERLQQKRQLFEHYRERLTGLAGYRLHRPPATTQPNHWLNLLLADDEAGRDALLQHGADRQLQLRPFWTPMHHLPMYADCPRAPLPVCEDLFARGICLPSSAQLAEGLR